MGPDMVDLTDHAQPANTDCREGALLLPAAGTNKLQKIQCEYVIPSEFAEKLYELATFYRRKKTSSFPTFR